MSGKILPKPLKNKFAYIKVNLCITKPLHSKHKDKNIYNACHRVIFLNSHKLLIKSRDRRPWETQMAGKTNS